MEIYRDSRYSPKERAKDLLSKLSIEEKMAQTYSMIPWSDSDIEDMEGKSDKITKYGSLVKLSSTPDNIKVDVTSS